MMASIPLHCCQNMTSQAMQTRLKLSFDLKHMTYCENCCLRRLLPFSASLGKSRTKAFCSKSASALISRYSASTSSWSFGRLRIQASVERASSSRPTFTSHLGEKGMNQIPKARQTAGMPWMMEGSRHARFDWPSPVPPM